MIAHPRARLAITLFASTGLFSVPGLSLVRKWIYRWAFGFRGVKVEGDVRFTNLHKKESAIEVGSKVVFQRGTTIDCSGGVDIADNVVFSMGAAVFTHAHHIHDRSTSWRVQGETPSGLRVETDVWVGSRAMIMPRVERLGQGAIIAAGSVVTSDVEAFSIVAGNPARVIGMRE